MRSIASGLQKLNAKTVNHFMGGGSGTIESNPGKENKECKNHFSERRERGIMKKKMWKQLIALVTVLTVSISMTVTSSAVSFAIPTDPISTEDQVIKTTAARAGQVAPLILGCNLVASSNLGASSNDYNKVNSILGVFGSAINKVPDPYLYNYNYNFYAAENGKPVVANATISEQQSEGTAATPEVIQNMLTHRPDLILNQAGGTGNNTENANYSAVIQTLPENTDADSSNDYKPNYYTCSISTLVYQCENLINLSKVVNSVCAEKNLKTRYEDPYVIATDYDKYVWGYYFYVQKQLNEGKIDKKSVAVVSRSSDNGATWELPVIAKAVDQGKPNRLVEYVRDNTNLLNTTEAGTAPLADVLACDVVIANGQGAALRSAASESGIDEDSLPVIIDTLPTCLYGMVMQTHENALGIPYLQSIIYGKELGLNPVYAAAYFYQNFFHITDNDALKETVMTLLSKATLPEGTTTSIAEYDPENVEDLIIQGIDYAKANNLARHDDTEAWNPDMSVGIGSDREVFTFTQGDAPVSITEQTIKSVAGESSTKSFTGKNGPTSVTAEFSKMTDVLENAGVTLPEDACFKIAASDGFTVYADSDTFGNMYIYQQESGSWRTAVDGSAGRMWVNDVGSVDAEDHVYVETDVKKLDDTQDTVTKACTNCGHETTEAMECRISAFKDVDRDQWYHNAVEYVADQNLFKGTSTDTFEPQVSMNRGMMVTVLYRMAGSPKTSGSSDFTDLTQDWYKDAVNWAQAEGIAQGTGAGKFDPDSKVTREQTATFLYRYADKVKGIDVSKTGDIEKYKDYSSINSWAQKEMGWANGAGIINGYPDNTLLPQGAATRAEMAQMLTNFSKVK